MVVFGCTFRTKRNASSTPQRQRLYQTQRGGALETLSDLVSNRDQGRFFSMASQSRLAISAPPKFFTSRIPVGDVTLISVM